MLRINRVKIEIATQNGIYGFDTPFGSGLTFLSSEENTCGKSSILAAVYFCLGLEEIIGGKGEKVLTSVFKTTLEDEGKTWNVLQSCAYLEISNGAEIITLYRSAKMKNRDSRMITIYYGGMDELSNPKILSLDTYVHFPNSAVNEKGFHNFLEKFLYLELPRVTASDDTQRKLYLQLIFSCMFIEQKHGWADLFSGMPILGIKESKKRVIEFVLNLDTLKNDKQKERLRVEEALIRQEWEALFKSLQIAARNESCLLDNFPAKPRILSQTDISRISIRNSEGLLSDALSALSQEASKLKQLKPKVVDNFEGLQEELGQAEADVARLSEYVIECKKQLSMEHGSIQAIKGNLETIAIDLSNNKDAARLRNLGSELQLDCVAGICPVCHQKIEDSLLPSSIDAPLMSIDENIKHLEAQQKMLQFALASHTKRKKELETEVQSVESRLFSLRRLAKSIRADLYSINDGYSEAVVYKKISIEKQIEELKKLQEFRNDIIEKLVELSKRWETLLSAKKLLPAKGLTDLDSQKLSLLRNMFINNLKTYGYKSIQDLNKITISEESYLPLFEGFDMKFDSSASDNIRVIWAFTMALLQVSLEKDGNHPTVLIFDEPDQQSTIINDMQAFFASILRQSDMCQVIMGITLKDSETKKVIQDIPEGKYTQVNVPYKAFRLIQNNI